MGENRARLTLAPFRSQPQWEGRKKHQRPLFLLAAQRDDPAAAPGAPPANEPANPPADAAPQPDGPAAASERSRHDPALLRQLGSPAPAPKRGARPRTSPAVALLRTIQQDVSLRLDQIEAALQRTEQRLDEQHRHQDQPPRPTIGAAPSPPPTDQHAAELAQLRSNLQGAREELIQLEQRLLVVRREVSQSTAATIDSAPPRTPEPTAGTPTDPLSIQGEIARLRILLVDEQNQSCRLRRELTQLPKAPPAAPAPAPLPASSRPIPLPSAILSQPRSRRRWFASRSWSRRTRRALLVAAACIVTLALGQWAFHRPPVTGPTPLPPSASSEMTTDIERGSLAAKPNLPDSLTARDPSGPATADRATAIVALESLRASVAAQPDDAGLRAKLAWQLAAAGLGREAVTQYREVLRLAPDNMAAVNNLAELLATHPDDTVRDGAAAVQLAEDLALKTAHTNPVILDTLAAAYAESGRFAEAVQMAQRARQAATRAGNQDLARVISDRLYWYRQDLPYREAPGGTDRASSPAP